MILYITSFTANGDLLNKKISDIFIDSDVRSYLKSERTENIKKWTENAFYDADAIIFIGAVGIAVRAISGLLNGKDKDPAVIVCDELGNYVIPILSGHIGGANDTANYIAQKISAQSIITTATDINGVWAVDSWAVKNNLKIKNIQNIKCISSALLNKQKVGIVKDIELDFDLPENVVLNDLNLENGIVISPFIKKVFPNTLNLVPKCIYIGVGSRKNADENALIELVESVLAQNNIDKYAICNIATIDIKENEKSVIKLCQHFGIKLQCYSDEQLNEVVGEFTKSDFVKKITGTDNVCERCATLSSDYGKILVKKTKGNGVTVSIAMKQKQQGRCFS